ncbi:alpha/beta fold hydrolase [Rhodococcoides yunnanense]|uniref:alpha/beta fold hydrolase n=1 Tax=Rhodococcoides yunnanense TaxID=278209 RepID=UPI000932563E|nr:alpha/beta hydrolase [Rhodococcus yunnanensis]
MTTGFDRTETFTLTRITTNGVVLNVALAGPVDGTPALLIHGWPHTWEVWRTVGTLLADRGYRVIAPDMRGVGASERPEIPFDVATTTADVVGILDALDLPDAIVVALDAGVPTAVYAALTRPSRVHRLVVMEGVLPNVPGAEKFLAAGPPWWFGFHATSGLAEHVLAGHEAEYLDYFLTGPSVQQDIGADVRAAFIDAYTGVDALRAGFRYYRWAERNSALFRGGLAAARLTMPVTSVEGGVVRDALSHQMAHLADNLTRVPIADCGHIVPLEQPQALTDAIVG